MPKADEDGKVWVKQGGGMKMPGYRIGKRCPLRESETSGAGEVKRKPRNDVHLKAERKPQKRGIRKEDLKKKTERERGI